MIGLVFCLLEISGWMLCSCYGVLCDCYAIAGGLWVIAGIFWMIARALLGGC